MQSPGREYLDLESLCRTSSWTVLKGVSAASAFLPFMKLMRQRTADVSSPAQG